MTGSLKAGKARSQELNQELRQAGKVREATAAFTKAKAALPPGQSNTGAMRIQVVALLMQSFPL